MSTQVALGIGVALYLLSCWRAWIRITRPERSTLKNPHSLHGAHQTTVPAGHTRSDAAVASMLQVDRSAHRSGAEGSARP
jgi:hypothetical protein